MRGLRNSSRALVLLALAIVIVSSPASAYHTGSTQTVSVAVGETITLQVNNWTGYTFNLASGETITYGIQSTGTEAIDVYFVNPQGLSDYASDTAPSFTYISALEDRTQVGGVFSSATGSVTVIIDNVDFSGAVPTGPVTVQVSLAESTGGVPGDIFGAILASIIICAVGLVVIVVVIVLIIYFVTKKPKPPAMPPMQPPAYGAPPYQAPPQQYAPQQWPPPEQPPQGPPPP